jgi:phage terminase small subunit
MRKFAFLVGCGETGAEACREAGYSDKGEAAKRTAYRMMQNPAVLEAVREVATKALGGLVPSALRAAEEILADKTHPQRARMIETILDRTGYSAKVEQKITVEHQHTVQLRADKVAARIQELLNKVGLPQLPAPIDVRPEEVVEGNSGAE